MDHPLKKQIDEELAYRLGQFVITGLDDLVNLACPECGYLKRHTVDCSRGKEDK